jgi:RNA polymerase sigma-70 factor (ECF subfamily)
MNVSLEQVAHSVAEGAVMSAFDDHHRELLRFARSLTRLPDDAEDLVGEAFLRLTREAQAGRFPEEPKAWLFRVVINLNRSRGRRTAVADRLRPFLPDRAPVRRPDEEFEARSTLDQLHVAVRALPELQRSVFLLSVSGFPGPEIAAIVGRSDGAVRMLIWRAREAIRAAMTEEGQP